MLALWVIFLSVLASARSRAATDQPRGLIWDWLVGGSKGGTTPRPAQRPGDRQDESSTGDLTGTWILGYPARRLDSVTNNVPGILNIYPQGSNAVLHPWWPAVYHHGQK